MKVTQAIQLMNEYTSKSIPYVFVVDFEMQNPLVYKFSEIPSGLFFDFNGFSNFVSNSQMQIHLGLSPLLTIAELHSKEKYCKRFAQVQNHISKGDTYLLNLTAQTEVNLGISMFEVFTKSKAPYKLYIDNKFVVFSPEKFIKIEDNKIYTFPMKGTIDANISLASEKILNSKKEKEEHATIVDLLRNDMSVVADNVSVNDYRYIEKISTHCSELLQVSSKIEGVLKSEFQNKFGSVLFSMLPAGSICGAPKPKTLELINSIEQYRRGFYCGVMGYFDGKIFDSAVMIRFIEKNGDKYYFKSGGGITYQSNCEDEYNELIQKIYVPIAGNN